MAKRKTAAAQDSLPDRVVRREHVDPQILLANPKNWRIHTPAQRRATERSIAHLGYLKPVIAQDGTNVIVDGHLRAEIAAQNGQKTIPVDYVNLTDSERDLALAAIDRTAGMADVDEEAYQGLVAQIKSETDDESLYAMFEDTATPRGPAPVLESYGTDTVDEAQEAENIQERYDNTGARQIMVLMAEADYGATQAALEKVMDQREFDKATDALVWLVEQDGARHG